MEFFSDNLVIWLAMLLPAAIVLGLDARRRARGQTGATTLRSTVVGLATAAALIGGFCLACGLIHLGCSWAVDRLMYIPMPIPRY